MSEFTNLLKSKADIGQLIGEFVALKPGGNGLIGLCPFHGEKTPSFHVHRAKGFYYCFGCHAHGDVFAFLMQFKKATFPEAVELVAERLGIEVPRGTGSEERDPVRQDLFRIHQAAAGFFSDALVGREGAGARAYLQDRELGTDTAARFQLGYAPPSGRALGQHLQREGFAPELALRSGLCQARRETADRPGASDAGALWHDLYDRFRDRLIFPIADDRGRVIAFGGRALAPDPSGKTPKYLNSPEHPLYTKGRVLYNLDRARTAIRELGYVILVEGYFDCIRVFAAGFENVVASCGTALTSSQVGPVARLAKKALLNFDPDTAGAAAAERSIGMLLEEGFQMRVVELSDGLDPDLFVRRRGREAYAEALKHSRSFFDYLAERTRRQFDLRRGEGKVQAINHLLPYLSHVHDPIVRQNLAENLAAHLGMDQPLISQQLLRAVRERRAILPPAAQPQQELLAAERIVVRTWLEDEARRHELGSILHAESLLAGLASQPLFEQLMGLEAAAAAQGEAASLDWQATGEKLPDSDRRLMAELLMAAPAQSTTSASEKETSAELAGALAALRERRGRHAIRELQKQIQAASQAGDMARVVELARHKAEWDSRLRALSAQPVLGRPEPNVSRRRAAV